MDGALTGKNRLYGEGRVLLCGGAEMMETGRFVIALLACGWPNNKTYKWSDARALFSYGLVCLSVRYARRFLENFGEVAVEEGVLPGQGIDETAEVPLLSSGRKRASSFCFPGKMR